MSGGKGGGGSGAGIGMVTGSLFEGFSNMQQINSQKDYLKELESSFQEDASYTQRVGDRKLSLLKVDQDQYYDRLQSQMAQSGISFDGTAVDLFNNTKVIQAQEYEAVKLDTSLKVNQSYRKASQAHSQREDIITNEGWSLVGGFLGGGAKGYSQWGGS